MIPTYTIDTTLWLPDDSFAGVIIPRASGIVGSLTAPPCQPCRLMVVLVCDTYDVGIDHSHVYINVANNLFPGVVSRCPWDRSDSHRRPGPKEWDGRVEIVALARLPEPVAYPISDAIRSGKSYPFERSCTGSTIVSQTFTVLGGAQSLAIWNDSARSLAVYVGRSLASPTS